MDKKRAVSFAVFGALRRFVEQRFHNKFVFVKASAPYLKALERKHGDVTARVFERHTADTR